MPNDGQIKETIVKDGITIKGGRDGLVITLGLGAWHNTLAALEERIAATPEFFKGARVVLNVGPRMLLEVDARAVRDMLAQYDVVLWGLISEDAETKHMADVMGLNAELPRPEPRSRSTEPTVAGPIEAAPPDDPDAGLLTRRTLRSGQQLRHPGSIALIGDVNPGAEIVAGGDIIVWGRLRGTVHAGAMGDEDAQVCALNMQPTQLRIAQHIARSPEDRRRKPSPEVARVRKGQIVVESWEVK
ncbi:MAG: septum site-determining protein MinC [Chloroflexi bacterium]|nr:septum site-determining protein MinC [Chloroflexota bacterium]